MPEPATASPPTTETCTCLLPIPVERAERKGAARTHCARCGKPLPLRL
jgi:hypothetical protein